MGGWGNYTFDEDVVGGGLDGDAFVAVRNLDIVDPVVGAYGYQILESRTTSTRNQGASKHTPDVNTIGATQVGSADRHVVDLTVRALLDDEVEFRSCGELG